MCHHAQLNSVRKFTCLMSHVPNVFGEEVSIIVYVVAVSLNSLKLWTMLIYLKKKTTFKNYLLNPYWFKSIETQRELFRYLGTRVQY